MWIGLAIIVALQFYYVQEMIAAFVILGVLVALAAGVGLLLFLIDRAGDRTLSWFGTWALSLLRTVRRRTGFVGALVLKSVATGGAQVSPLNRTRLRHPRLGTAR